MKGFDEILQRAPLSLDQVQIIKPPPLAQTVFSSLPWENNLPLMYTSFEWGHKSELDFIIYDIKAHHIPALGVSTLLSNQPFHLLSCCLAVSRKPVFPLCSHACVLSLVNSMLCELPAGRGGVLVLCSMQLVSLTLWPECYTAYPLWTRLQCKRASNRMLFGVFMETQLGISMQITVRAHFTLNMLLLHALWRNMFQACESIIITTFFLLFFF